MSLPYTVTITEVSPRDGLQDEKTIVSTENKLKFIHLLADAGLSHIEATSFVSPKRIPALADHNEVMRALPSDTRTQYSALIPNTQGLKNAMQAGCKHIAVFTTVSETFAQKNIQCSISESLQRITEVIAIAKPAKITIRGYISCTLGCPYEGLIAIEKTAQLAKQLLAMGCDEIALADTIGTGTPKITQELIQAVTRFVPIEKIAIHFHDTYGQAIANIYAALTLGVAKIDSSVGGLGGCPYAKGASGNVATEEVLYLLNGLNIHTGVDLNKIIRASDFIHAQLDHPTRSKVAMQWP